MLPSVKAATITPASAQVRLMISPSVAASSTRSCLLANQQAATVHTVRRTSIPPSIVGVMP